MKIIGSNTYCIAMTKWTIFWFVTNKDLDAELMYYLNVR